jgi:hypothetical protein
MTLIFGHLFKYLKCEVAESSPANLLMACQVESEGVYILKNTFDTAIYVALLGLGLSS